MEIDLINVYYIFPNQVDGSLKQIYRISVYGLNVGQCGKSSGQETKNDSRVWNGRSEWTGIPCNMKENTEAGTALGEDEDSELWKS